MNTYNIVTQSKESTVVAEYTSSAVRSDAYQSETDLEREFIALLKTQGYEYLPIHTEADLITNLRKQLESLNGIRFTDAEWKRFFTVHLANANEGITEKTRKIQEGDSRINFKRDDGLTKNIALINKIDIHANTLQVINQYENNAGTYKNRYDVTVLVNGCPLYISSSNAGAWRSEKRSTKSTAISATVFGRPAGFSSMCRSSSFLTERIPNITAIPRAKTISGTRKKRRALKNSGRATVSSLLRFGRTRTTASFPI